MILLLFSAVYGVSCSDAFLENDAHVSCSRTDLCRYGTQLCVISFCLQAILISLDKLDTTYLTARPSSLEFILRWLEGVAAGL